MSFIRRLKVSGCLMIAYMLLVAACWFCIYLVGGTFGVVSWWFVMCFSVVGAILLAVTALRLTIGLLFGFKLTLPLFFILITSVVAAWPFGWFFDIGKIAYPAKLHRVKPAIEVGLPIKQTLLVGWGGDDIDKNYHVVVPMERWAYDFLILPAATKSKRLEDYGVYGAEVVAPASGTIVGAFDEEEDIEPGSEDYKSQLGNHIFLKLDETETFIVMAHLKKSSLMVAVGQHVKEGTPLAQVGNSGATSEPHLHIHHQRQDPSKTSMFFTEGLPLYFRDIDGSSMPEGGLKKEGGLETPIGELISPIK